MMGNNWMMGSEGFEGMNQFMKQMIFSGGGSFYLGSYWLVELSTRIAIIALLLAAARWLWKKGNTIK